MINKESLNYFKIVNKNSKLEKEPMQAPVDFFLPMSTKMYDLRVKGVNFCEWDEEFIINEKVETLMRGNVAFMFEILEFNPHLVIDKSPLLNSEKLYPVAWAYLRPLGTASIHIEKVKLQLYKYKFHSDKSMKFNCNRPIDLMTPEVLVELNFQGKEKFNSFLEVEL